MSRFLLASFLLISICVHSQELTGIWRGHFLSSNSRLLELLGEEDRYKFEVQLNQRAKDFEGVTYSYKTTVFYGKASCIGKVNSKTKKVLLEEMKIVEVRMANGSDACIMTCFLQYYKSGVEEFLEGTYTSMNIRDSSNCGRGTIFLRKVITSDFYKEPFLVKREKEKERSNPKSSGSVPNNTTAKKPVTTTKPPIGKPANKSNTTVKPGTTVTKKPLPTNPTAGNNTTKKIPEGKTTRTRLDTTQKTVRIPSPAIVTPNVLRNRENELVKTIETSEKEILINIYDNGSIDNDTVSVYLDKKLVINKQRLTEKPLQVKLLLDENNIFHELVMVAENLGEIPPNTSLMVVKAGSSQYEVRITSTEQKNAVVIFKYQKEK